jgi:hypothetical protein
MKYGVSVVIRVHRVGGPFVRSNEELELSYPGETDAENAVEAIKNVAKGVSEHTRRKLGE